MPAVPHTKSAPSEHGLPPAPPPDAESSARAPAVQPAPSVVDATSHTAAHVFSRRFLGPMPYRAATSKKAEAARAERRELRRKGLRRLLARGDDEEDEDEAAPRHVHLFRVRRRTSLGDETEREYAIDDGSSSSSEEEFAVKTIKAKAKGKGKDKTKEPKDKKVGKKGKKKKKKKKGAGDVWVGNSFDIGAEFESPPDGRENTPASMLGQDMQESPEVVHRQLHHDGENIVPEAGPSTLPLPTASSLPGSKPASGLSTPGSGMSTPRRPGIKRGHSSRAGSTSSTGGETFVTALDHAHDDGSDESTFHAIVPDPQPLPSDGLQSQNSSPRAAASSQGDSRARLIHSSDEEADLGPSSLSPRQSESRLRARTSGSIASLGRDAKQAINARLKSALRGDAAHSDERPRSKTVQFRPHDDVAPSGAQAPAHPYAVLARSGSSVEGTSADAVGDALPIDDDVLPGGIVMRDRACVKVGRHREENMGHFDELTQRRSPCYRIDPMEEYVLGMTVTSIDFYLDWFWPLEEKIKGHKRLAYCVPLSAPTTLSVFNKTDMTLALTCPWSVIVRNTARHLDKTLRSQTSRWDRTRHGRISDTLHMSRQGSAVFLITFGERSRALDWFWYISGQLGVKLPRQIDIRVPVLEMTLRIAVPEEPSSTTFNSATILRSVWKAVLSNNEQTRLLRELGAIPTLRLAWKEVEPTVEWVCWDTTVTDRPREWALLASFAHGLSRPRGSLQVRDATHYGIRVRLEDGTLLAEPEGIEGYLVRHKTVAAPKEEIYLSIVDGHAFFSPAQTGTPPLIPQRRGSSPAELFPELHKKFLDSERRRLGTFVEKCTGCIDLSRITSTRLVKPTELTGGLDAPPVDPNEPNYTAEGPPKADPPPRAKSVAAPQQSELSPLKAPQLPRADTTSQLQGADTTEVAVPSRRTTALTPLPKEGKKGQREFEVTFRDGVTVVFEAHTPEIAAEWVRRLTELVRYWTTRRRVDARSAMDVVQLHMGREAFVGQALDLHTETLVNQLWNWCVIDGCRPVTHSGRVYVRRSKWGKFRSFYLVLMQGSLVAFSSDGRAGMQPRRAVWPLFGSFVYSGMLAQDELDANPNESAWDPQNRVYQDGLQSNDGAEDTTFCVRLLWPHGRFAPPQPWDLEKNRKETGAQADFVPPPLKKEPQRLLVCRARSKLERDRWVWALNCEKERFARAFVRDEETLRNTGVLPRHSTLTHTDASLKL
ncbi:hypothetical protein CC85DRAFT_285951 [Cutaneotrichosporon oleaginosum]|uniref:PH domain-containing protein n=1 Tax=Cutaneotrichosporon oleaginosum TaxID=879819 RepID=A0A0J0XLN9_9TREE|nr:uncharacterized protein CC85DRAFT_285951 [Cutaneotrichosporon oleaginosum]KLT42021.1 hypothetical protein CC85DRAFT_285951 [Cutaneotrichosporon oleaginosum]TXT14323.1 hypothetical protein COLE_00516 [Cutaneotrichosporon oleaginosum]